MFGVRDSAVRCISIHIRLHLQCFLYFLLYFGKTKLWAPNGSASNHDAIVAPAISDCFLYLWWWYVERVLGGIRTWELGAATWDLSRRSVVGGVNLRFGWLDGEVGPSQDLHRLMEGNRGMLGTYLQVAVISKERAIVPWVQLSEPFSQLGHQISDGNREEDGAEHTPLMYPLLTHSSGVNLIRVVVEQEE